jgi:acyl-CoA reductase-like NAD-dependent aldehyde dehydrogenase
LGRRFPDLAEKLVKAFRARLRKEKANKRARIIRAIVAYLRAHGPDVSAATISREFGLTIFSVQKDWLAKARKYAANPQMELPLIEE